jgi:glycosyltransferase involved in cell wall biosynthesis
MTSRVGQQGWSVAVVVPARDEERTVAASLRSIARALEHAGVDDHRVVMVADRCGDRTVARAIAAMGPSGRVVECDQGNVGAARAVGVAAALVGWDGEASHRWLASTDADTVVPLDWIERQLRHARAGAHGVAGVVELLDAPGSLERRFRSKYVLDAARGHPHVHGANLGVHVEWYRRVGGWSSLRTGEDHDLWGRLRAGGAMLVSDTSLRVRTSARLRARAPGGFAGDLRALVAGS